VLAPKGTRAAATQDEECADHDCDQRGAFRATYDHCTSKFLSQAGVRNTHLRGAGLHGNGHMMMLEQNSAKIADVIGNWLDANIK
jgi:hypothetical protein